MKYLRIIIITSTIVLAFTKAYSQIKTLETFDSKDGWEYIKSDGVDLNLSVEMGIEGNAICFDYDFTKGTGYGGIQKWFPIDLPENYEFTFWVKAESPSNNFEIKFIDSSGDNVWWVNNRNYTFPTEWTKIRIKKRHIGFAWGPTEDKNLKRVDRIEFTVASFLGGKGTVWIDDLRFEPLDTEPESYPKPKVNTSSTAKKQVARLIIDDSDETHWLSKGVKNQSVVFDFTLRREFGGLQISWLENFHANKFNILLSNDAKTWNRVYSVKSNQSNESFIRLAEANARFLKIELLESNNPKRFGICEIKFLDIASSLSQNDFLIYTAKNSPIGNFPR